MAKTDVYQFDSTANNNTDINSIDIDEDCNPSGVNNAFRQMMAYMRDLTKAQGGASSSAGTDTVTLATAMTITAYEDGMSFGFIAGGTNTGATTLNVDSVGAKKLLRADATELSAGDVTAGYPYIVFYDASADAATGAWLLINPTSSSGLSNVVEDTTPQLGGDLDVNSNSLVSIADGDITIEPNGTGSINLNAADVLVEEDIVHTGDVNNKVIFGTDTQTFQTGGSTRMDLSDSGVRFGAAGARITQIYDEDNMASDSATGLATQQSIKAYVDASGAGLVLIDTIDLSNDASAAFDSTDFDNTTYDQYLFTLANVIPATDAVDLVFRTGNDDTGDSGASDYVTQAITGINTTVQTARYTAAQIELLRTIAAGSAVGEDGISGNIWLHNPGLTKRTHLTWQLGYIPSSGGAPNWVSGTAYRDEAAVVTYVEWTFSSGNLESGQINMYGLKAS